VHLELGLIGRQRGSLEAAERDYGKAIELGQRVGENLVVASAYNSLGMMFQQMEPLQAIHMFQACLASLSKQCGLERQAQVINNLGLAYANAGQWEDSRKAFEQSLDIKRSAGDLIGQALTLQNVARVYQAQQKGVAARNALTEIGRFV
jgi:tetratricopeptide (TPR) repeat protein